MEAIVMSGKHVRLWSVALPIVIILESDILDWRFVDVTHWFKGDEFLTIVSQLITQLFTGVIDGLLGSVIYGFFGVAT
jgi:hypothetical protein